MSHFQEAAIVTGAVTAGMFLLDSFMDYRDAVKRYDKKIQGIDSNPQLPLLEKDYPKKPTYLGELKDYVTGLWPW